ncbi:hypothetical protein HG537_0F01910 [Torulaspora globosa]|uniref:Trimethylguanosine synthase n=1 Tax=Torulaspora globosa TaxID=48254 RepID=A0A7H9HVM9_9SACH|nr:hypothetical protein HG537_0F01910 [Torulaspora sp. CBS 2947]
MARKVFDKCHFLHIDRHKHRKEYKRLKKLFRDNAYVVNPNEAVRNKRLLKYWRTRKLLFSKINDCPIYMTDELWFSVTPELIAKFLAKFIRACLPGATKVMDVFCGGGGNTIQLAKIFPIVYGIDSSLEHLYCTYRNARAYDVADRIWLKHGSWQDIAAKGRFAKLGIDCIFGSPPWGGPDYLASKSYDLETALQPMGITEMLASFLSVSPNVILFLPRNSNLDQISRATRRLLGPAGQCRVVYVKTNGYTKGLLCMWGAALVSTQEEQPDVGTDDERPHEQRNESQDAQDKNIPINYDLDG